MYVACRTTRKSEFVSCQSRCGRGASKGSWGLLSPYMVKSAITETKFCLSRVVKSDERLKLHADTTPTYV